MISLVQQFGIISHLLGLHGLTDLLETNLSPFSSEEMKGYNELQCSARQLSL